MTKVKLLTTEQTKSVSELILWISAGAYIKGEITQEEKDVIIHYVSQCAAFTEVLEEQEKDKK